MDTNKIVRQTLSENLNKATFRKAFVNDPNRALERIGLQVGDIPESEIEILADMTQEELDLLGKINVKTSRLPTNVGTLAHGFGIF